VAQPVREIGETALALLLDRIGGLRVGPGEVTVMPPKLIIRRSCGTPSSPAFETVHVA
jgi:LacI family transcriptional regulator